MSAWLVSNDHINTMITYALDNDVSLYPANDADGLCRMMTEENMKSLRHRYPDDFLEWEDAAKTYKFVRVKNIARKIRQLRAERNRLCDGRFGKLPPLTSRAIATQIVKACDCYNYQACEHEDYHESDVAKFVNRLCEKAVTLGGCDEGTLYDQMSWGLD